jgi:hypothetical protein
VDLDERIEPDADGGSWNCRNSSSESAAAMNLPHRPHQSRVDHVELAP